MKWLIAGAVAAIAAIGAGGVADAKKDVEVYFCNGVRTEIEVAGRSGWISGIHYLAHNLVVAGTFDPVGPAPAEAFTETQWSSGRTGGLLCTSTFTETNDEGTVTATITLNAIPTGN